MPEETHPFIVQCKAVETGKYLHDVLEEMMEMEGKYKIGINNLKAF